MKGALFLMAITLVFLVGTQGDEAPCVVPKQFSGIFLWTEKDHDKPGHSGYGRFAIDGVNMRQKISYHGENPREMLVLVKERKMYITDGRTGNCLVRTLGHDFKWRPLVQIPRDASQLIHGAIGTTPLRVFGGTDGDEEYYTTVTADQCLPVSVVDINARQWSEVRTFNVVGGIGEEVEEFLKPPRNCRAAPAPSFTRADDSEEHKFHFRF